MDENKRQSNTKLLNFLYSMQSKRQMNPVWVLFFTKEGWLYIALGYYLFFHTDSGAFTLAGYLGILVWGNRKYRYRYYEHEKLKFYKVMLKFLMIQKRDNFKSIKNEIFRKD